MDKEGNPIEFFFTRTRIDKLLDLEKGLDPDPYCNVLPPNLHLRSRGRNLQATGCDLGGKPESSVVT